MVASRARSGWSHHRADGGFRIIDRSRSQACCHVYAAKAVPESGTTYFYVATVATATVTP
jgi:hypothetical protein